MFERGHASDVKDLLRLNRSKDMLHVGNLLSWWSSDVLQMATNKTEFLHHVCTHVSILYFVVAKIYFLKT